MQTNFAICGCLVLLCGAVGAHFSGAHAGTAFVFNTITLPNNAKPTFIDDTGRIFAEVSLNECYTWTKGVVKHFNVCPANVSGNGSLVYNADHGGANVVPKGGKREVVRIPGLHRAGPGYGVNNSGYAVGWSPKRGGGWLWLGTEAQSYKLPDPDGEGVLPNAISDTGVIVGINGNGTRAFVYRNGVYTYFLQGTGAEPKFVTENGTIGGWYSAETAFIGSAAKGFTTLNNILLTGVGPNEEGVGWVGSVGLIWENGNFYTINYPGTTGGTKILGVNKNGTIVGSYSPDGKTITAFYATCSSPDKVCTQ